MKPTIYDTVNGLCVTQTPEVTGPALSDGQLLTAATDRELAKGPLKTGGCPPLGESWVEDPVMLEATTEFRRKGETLNSLVARSGLYNEFRTWPRERLKAHIDLMESLANDQGATEPKPNCI